MTRDGLRVAVMSSWATVLSTMVPLLAAAAGPGAPVEVRGEGITCPTAAEVEQRIGALLPAGAGFAPNEWVELRELPSARAGGIAIAVRLRRQDLDPPLGERRLEREGTCAELAEAIAVVATSWKGQFALPEPAVPVVVQLPPSATRASAPTVVAGAARPTGFTRFGVAGFGGVPPCRGLAA